MIQSINQVQSIKSDIMRNQPTKQKETQLKWTSQQEGFIKELYEENKVKSWKTISDLINEKYSRCNKNSKQCRDRYINYIKYNKKKNDEQAWSQSESKLLFQKYAQFGSKWSTIAKQLNNKSQNSVKNRFYNLFRKFIRKINITFKQINKNNCKKPIKQDSVMKILQFSKILETSHSEMAYRLKQKIQKYNFLRMKIIELIQFCENGSQKSQSMLQIINLIIEFGRETRFMIVGKKNKKKSKNGLDKSIVKDITVQESNPMLVCGQYDKIISQLSKQKQMSFESEIQSQVQVIGPNERIQLSQNQSQLNFLDQGAERQQDLNISAWQDQISNFLHEHNLED